MGNAILQSHLREHKTLSGINIMICKSSKEIKKCMFKISRLRIAIQFFDKGFKLAQPWFNCFTCGISHVCTGNANEL